MRNAGYTIVETALAASLGVTLLVTATMLVRTGTDTHRTVLDRVKDERIVDRILGEMQRLISDSSHDRIQLVDLPDGNTMLDIQYLVDRNTWGISQRRFLTPIPASQALAGAPADMVLPTNSWSDDVAFITSDGNTGFKVDGTDRFGTVTRFIAGQRRTTLYRYFIRPDHSISSVDLTTANILYGDPERPGFKIVPRGNGYLVTVHVESADGVVTGGSRFALPRN